jgi:hypothetical protein
LAGHFFQQSFYSSFFDPLKRKLFFLPVRWHSRHLNDGWTDVEQRAAREIRQWVKPPDEVSSSGDGRTPEPLPAVPTNFTLWLLRSVAYVWIFRNRIGFHLGRILRGDRDAIGRVVWFIRTFVIGQRPKRQGNELN